MSTAYQALQALSAPNGLGAGMANLFAAILESNANKKREEQSKADRARAEALGLADRAREQRNADREAADRAKQREQQLRLATLKANEDAMRFQQGQVLDALKGAAAAGDRSARDQLAQMGGVQPKQEPATWNSLGQGLMDALRSAMNGQTPVANPTQPGIIKAIGNVSSQNGTGSAGGFGNKAPEDMTSDELQAYVKWAEQQLNQR